MYKRKTVIRNSENQNGTVMLFVVLLLPVVLYMSYSANSRGKSDISTQTDYTIYTSLSRHADNAISMTINDKEQINEAILTVKNGGDPDAWQTKTYGTSHFTTDVGVSAETRVRASKMPLANSSPNQLAVYLVEIQAEVSKAGVTLVTESHQQLSELGVP